MEMEHKIEVYCPTEWSPATQLHLVKKDENNDSMVGNKANLYTFSAPDRDRLLDGIIEVKNENIHFVMGNHVLKLWDSGGFKPIHRW